jgi:ribosomal protein S18 acetylase RimI-like enzyme
MAARLYPAPARHPELVDLRRISARDLEALLEEECAAWRNELEWDFDKSADLVRRFVDMNALNGSALFVDDEIAGYMYYVLEEDKGLIGDLYVCRAQRTTEHENLLIGAALEPIMRSPGITRIESQLMMVAHDPFRSAPQAEYLNIFPRNFMRIDLRRAVLGKGHIRRAMYIEKWSDHYHDATAQLIAAAYAGHIDSRINDQYRSPAGARRFLHNIVQYPGCGAFYRPASFAAFEGLTGRLCGVSLASLVTPETGHVTQICVSPEVRGTGIGHELLRQSLTTLRDMGCNSASLTVTSANEDAVSLYERVGFETIRQFSAYVWEGF